MRLQVCKGTSIFPSGFSIISFLSDCFGTNGEALEFNKETDDTARGAGRGTEGSVERGSGPLFARPACIDFPSERIKGIRIYFPRR